MLNKLCSSDFLPHLNSIFRIHLNGLVDPVDLELAAVDESGSMAKMETRQPFSLFFLGPVSSQYLLQHTYRLEHDKLGALDIFIVPLGTVQGRMRYEAIFS
jgi:hypothetical protein